MADYSSVLLNNNGKINLSIIVGKHPEMIVQLVAINKPRKYFDVLLTHTGENYNYIRIMCRSWLIRRCT